MTVESVSPRGARMPSRAPSPDEVQKWRVNAVVESLRKLATFFHLSPTGIKLTDILKEEGTRQAFDNLQKSAQMAGVDIAPVLEITLPIITALPQSYPRTRKAARRSQRREARNRPTLMRKWADELEKWLQEARSRSDDAHDNGRQPSPSGADFVQLPEKLRACADFLQQRLVFLTVLSYGSRNPQIRSAVFLSSFVKAVTGRYADTQLAVLLESAFEAAKKDPPSWIDRLTLERTRRRRVIKRLFDKWLSSRHLAREQG